MPQMKSASSLSDICLVFISQNVKMFCNELEIGKQADVADVTDVEDSTTNPFHQLPSILLEALINIITEKTQAGDKQTERFLHQLITPHLSTISLDSTMVDKIDVFYILRLATIRCKHLKTLRLYDFSYRYRDCLNFIPKFSKLQLLYISSTRKISDSLSGDYFFHLLGAHCKDTR
ncbi:uncharacterized protein LOC124208635 [Daphnia pulex]|uniref:uncharacterized protein LOC124208635 n=1 Tax=Daphnia pulex TaxID=6669 RepID=UPI001EE00DAD|nr:uncharacterized protein LOC124208635 [Daphnia pulex]